MPQVTKINTARHSKEKVTAYDIMRCLGIEPPKKIIYSKKGLGYYTTSLSDLAQLPPIYMYRLIQAIGVSGNLPLLDSRAISRILMEKDAVTNTSILPVDGSGFIRSNNIPNRQRPSYLIKMAIRMLEVVMPGMQPMMQECYAILLIKLLERAGLVNFLPDLSISASVSEWKNPIPALISDPSEPSVMMQCVLSVVIGRLIDTAMEKFDDSVNNTKVTKAGQFADLVTSQVAGAQSSQGTRNSDSQGGNGPRDGARKSTIAVSVVAEDIKTVLTTLNSAIDIARNSLVTRANAWVNVVMYKLTGPVSWVPPSNFATLVKPFEYYNAFKTIIIGRHGVYKEPDVATLQLASQFTDSYLSIIDGSSKDDFTRYAPFEIDDISDKLYPLITRTNMRTTEGDGLVQTVAITDWSMPSETDINACDGIRSFTDPNSAGFFTFKSNEKARSNVSGFLNGLAACSSLIRDRWIYTQNCVASGGDLAIHHLDTKLYPDDVAQDFLWAIALSKCSGAFLINSRLHVIIAASRSTPLSGYLSTTDGVYSDPAEAIANANFMSGPGVEHRTAYVHPSLLDVLKNGDNVSRKVLTTGIFPNLAAPITDKETVDQDGNTVHIAVIDYAKVPQASFSYYTYDGTCHDHTMKIAPALAGVSVPRSASLIVEVPATTQACVQEFSERLGFFMAGVRAVLQPTRNDDQSNVGRLIMRKLFGDLVRIAERTFRPLASAVMYNTSGHLSEAIGLSAPNVDNQEKYYLLAQAPRILEAHTALQAWIAAYQALGFPGHADLKDFVQLCIDNLAPDELFNAITQTNDGVAHEN